MTVHVPRVLWEHTLMLEVPHVKAVQQTLIAHCRVSLVMLDTLRVATERVASLVLADISP